MEGKEEWKEMMKNLPLYRFHCIFYVPTVGIGNSRSYIGFGMGG